MKTGIAQVAAGLDACAGSSPVFLSDEDLTTALDDVQRLITRLAAVQLALVRELDGRGLALAQGAASPTAWLRDRHNLSPRTASALVTLAADTDRLPRLATALAGGEVNIDQARVIAAAIGELPRDLGPAERDLAETELVGFAATLDPARLRTAGRRIHELIDPDGADTREADLLERQQRHAYTTRELTLSRDHLTGRVRLTGWLDIESAAIVHAALDPLCKPGDRQLDDRTPKQRRADALTDLCQLTLATGDLPDNGGERPHLTLVARLDTLTGQIGTATLDTGDRLSPTAVRRIACDTQILPAIMDSDGQILDLGRTQRLWHGPARKAVVLRDGGCTFPGCDRPPRWCHLHHVVPWQHGGPTDRDNAVTLCTFHHRLIHHSEWTIHMRPDGHPEFTPPRHIDPQQRPRRNTLHRRA